MSPEFSAKKMSNQVNLPHLGETKKKLEIVDLLDIFVLSGNDLMISLLSDNQIIRFELLDD